MTKTTFVNGTPVNPDFLNSINNPVFDGLDFDGHFAKITNSDLSDTAGQIKPEWTTFRDTLKVQAATGLTVGYQGGSVILADSAIATISPANLSVTNNATNYVYVSEVGTVAVGSLLPVRCTPLAKVITSAGSISSVVDLRPRFQIQPRANTVASFGSGGYEGDLTISSNQSLSGTKYVRNFTLNTGVNLTVSGFLHIIASGTVTIDGSINVAPIVPGGRGFAGSPPATSLILADSGLGPGGGGGHNSSPAPVYSYSFSGAANTGSGGAAGLGIITNSLGSSQFITSKGGAGGGVFIVDAALGIAVTGAINCNSGNAVIGSVLVAESEASIVLPGAGGGSGGLIWLKSLVSITVTAAAVLSAKGGNGANGVRQNFSSGSGGGAGGGGGYVVLQSPNTNTTGATINLTGGTGGTASGTPPGVSASLGGTFGGQSGTATDSNGGNGGSGQLILQSFLPI
ncbi:MAG: hypothetical protein KME60_24165 [Cyanomargarita calcarea GSE-NOS-MK-12-04C]|jgi:hypothetical protein|uniref:Uncharacterized protein n=1 Tax=Cyanomargarita calcarea GSE-NOS-MK-12-04C TaxID=2839659 RepID=A0A951UUU4_9CYAN|nr:hypothetical protein [Cyanomargarita calcarea GSE-NOS-MK-12-04C]